MARRQAVLMRSVRRSQAPKDKKHNHRDYKIKEVFIMEIGILFLFLLIGIFSLFENTKAADKITDYIIKKIMK